MNGKTLQRTRILATLLACIVALVTSAGCGKKSDTSPVSQVAAKVNGGEITVHQVNYALARTRNGGGDGAIHAKHQILNALIEQELAKQQAIARKLDRSPAVLSALEAARTQILARAYLEHVAATQPEPTEQEARSFYAEHPELFARRRVYDLEEISVAPAANIAAALQKEVQEGRSMQDIASWLKLQHVKFNVNRGVRAAEQLPLEWLRQLQAMNEGDIQLLGMPGKLHVIRIVASRAAPIDEAAATPRIQQFLRNQRTSEAIAKEIKQLKDSAKIDYVGEFSKEASVSMQPLAHPQQNSTPTSALDTNPSTQSPTSPEVVNRSIRGAL